MNGTVFVVLLTISSIVTSLVTEVWKKLTTFFPINVMALITGVVVGAGTGALYMFLNSVAYNTTSIIYIILLAGASGFAAMLGYDKVKQAIEQIREALAFKKF